MIYSPKGMMRYNDSDAIVDDIPLLSQWIKKSTCENKSIFWWERMGTLRRRDFDRFGRCPKSLALLETSQSTKPTRLCDCFGGPSSMVLISPFQFHQTKKPPVWVVFCLVGADGFGPSKSLTTDLQSAPFGHLGTLPNILFFQKSFGAGGRIRTPDLLITNQLLYQLSYTSTKQLYYNTTTV